jgi:hypothetical protein
MPPSVSPHSLARLPRRGGLMLLLAAIAVSGPVFAQSQTPSFSLTLRDRQWEPATLEVPANQKIELRITNAGASAAEFESTDLRREKIIPPGHEVVVYIGPLRPGSYEFFDDFNPAARGRITAR